MKVGVGKEMITHLRLLHYLDEWQQIGEDHHPPKGGGSMPTRAGPSESANHRNGDLTPIRMPMVVPNLVSKIFGHDKGRVQRCCDNGYIGMGRHIDSYG